MTRFLSLLQVKGGKFNLLASFSIAFVLIFYAGYLAGKASSTNASLYNEGAANGGQSMVSSSDVQVPPSCPPGLVTTPSTPSGAPTYLRVSDLNADEIIAKWNNVRLSELWAAQGLHPSDIEGGMHATQAKQMLNILQRAEKHGRVIRNICETGFFRGGSSLFWMLTKPEAIVHSFDMGMHRNAKKWFSERFPGRWFGHEGDSTKTLVQFHQENPNWRCDLVLVDGGHQGEIPYIDLTNFKKLSHAKTIVIMDDTFAESDPNFNLKPLTCSQAWKRAKDEMMTRPLPENEYGPSCTPFGRTPNGAWPIGQCTGEYIM